MEKRLTRVEEKLDKVHEDVIELKSDLKHLIPKVDEHITGDKKIINHIGPLLEKLPALVEIVEEHQYEKKKMKENKEKMKNMVMGLGVVSTFVGIVIGVTKLMG